MADEDYQAFRAAVLEGTDPDGRDTPPLRAAAAADHLNQVAEAAATAEDGARARIEKATADLEAAKESLADAIASRAAADAAAAMGRQLAAEFTQAQAGVAGAEGGA